MSETNISSQSTWRSKIKAMGPGILMASAAVGGSHIVSSTQAGGSYGWALLGLVILANLFKYPFFRFGAEYTADTGKTLVEGYAEKGKFYLWVFFILNVFSALVNTAGVSILCSAIIASAFPMLGLSITTWSIILVAIIWGMLLFGGYKLLDGMAKWIMSALTIATDDALFDFNVGFIGTAILAVFFVALGALIQYPTGKPVEAASAKYIAQFVGMYASVLGEWSRYLITFIAFLCIFGTVITVIDGYSRVNEISLRLLFNQKEKNQTPLNVWMTLTAILGLIIIFFFQGQVATMLRFAMIGSFLTTKAKRDLPTWLKGLAIAGLIFLFGFALFFIWALAIGKAG